VALLAASQAQAGGGGTSSLYPSANERLGFGVAFSETNIHDFDVERLHAGWWVNWGIAPEDPHPAGLDFVQILRVCDDDYRDCGGHAYRPYGQELAAIVAANPGNLWLVGNEPDCLYQDSVGPERYAAIYHEVYQELKRLDPTAQVGIGGIVQATPLRMRWLDRVWQEYQRRYGEPMPVDVWNVHGFVLREVRWDWQSGNCLASKCAPPGATEWGCWGCNIPPGISADCGRWIEIDDLDRMDLFAEQIVRFRQWMADHGQRDKPLIVSEYTILFNEELGYGFERVRDYMLATFDYFLNATDPDIGYPADGNRLVQRWAWYSLDDDSFGWGTTWGVLFNRHTHEITPMGEAFGEYAARLITPYVDLYPQRVSWAWAEPPVYGESPPLVVTAVVANRGNTVVQEPFVVRAWLGKPGGGGYLGQTTVSSVPSRYAGQSEATITRQVAINGPIEKMITVRVDTTRQVAESDEENNQSQVELRVDVDVALEEVRFEPPIPPLVQPGETVTATVIARVVNEGDVEVRDLGVRFETADDALPGSETLTALPPGGAAEVRVTWPGRGVGVHEVTVIVDPAAEVVESDEGNNGGWGRFLVASERRMFPLVYSNTSAG